MFGHSSLTAAVEQIVAVWKPGKDKFKRRVWSFGRHDAEIGSRSRCSQNRRLTGHLSDEDAVADDDAPGLIEQIAEHVNGQDDVIATKDIADGIGADARSKDFKEALSAAALTGRIARIKEGKYGPAA